MKNDIEETAIRYSKALLAASSEDDYVSQLQALDALVRVFDDFPDLLPFVASPIVPDDLKERALEKSLGVHFKDPLKSFLFRLIERGRLKALPEIYREYSHLVANKLDLLHARLVTAFEIDDSLKESIKKRFEENYGKKIELKTEVDPNLIGGGKLFINNHLIDFSVKGKLNNLKEELLKT